MRLPCMDLVVLAAWVGTAHAQAGVSTAEATTQAARRDALLQPGLEALKKGDAALAVEEFKPALSAFPRDQKVLLLSAEAAMDARHNEDALGLFQRALEEKPVDPWRVRFAVILLDARLMKWPEFRAGLAELKAAKQAGDDRLTSPGYVVGEFEAGGKQVEVAYYPLLAGRFHTLYRFVLPKDTPRGGSTTEESDPRCKDPDFRPYFNVESDDADQGMHPELSKKGDRVYSLDTYPAPCSQGLIKFYAGEPRYESVRADVIKAVDRSAR